MDSVGSVECLSVDSGSDVNGDADEDEGGGMEEATACCGSAMHIEGMGNFPCPADDDDNAYEGVGEDVHCEDGHPEPSVITPFRGEVTCRRTPVSTSHHAVHPLYCVVIVHSGCISICIYCVSCFAVCRL